MTLADFLKVFDFEFGKIEICTLLSYNNAYTFSGSYETKSAVERDFFTLVYNVVDVHPVDETTIQIAICH